MVNATAGDPSRPGRDTDPVGASKDAARAVGAVPIFVGRVSRGVVGVEPCACVARGEGDVAKVDARVDDGGDDAGTISDCPSFGCPDFGDAPLRVVLGGVGKFKLGGVGVE